MSGGKPRSRPREVRLSEQPELDPISSSAIISAITSSIAIEVILPPHVLRSLHLEHSAPAPVIIVTIASTEVTPIEVPFESPTITVPATASSVVVIRKGDGRHRQSHYYRANHCFYRSIHLFQCQHVPSFWNLEKQSFTAPEGKARTARGGTLTRAEHCEEAPVTCTQCTRRDELG